MYWCLYLELLGRLLDLQQALRTCKHFDPAGPAATSNLQPLYLTMYM